MAPSETDLTVPSLFNVAGKVALVTGGGSGLGSMMAAALVQNGAKVYIASRKEKQLKEVTEALNAQGPGSCHYFVADLGTKAGCDALADQIKANTDNLDILVNNSGVSWGASWDNTPEKEGWDRVMALNVKSIFYLTVALTDLLAKGASGEDPARVINISSVASWDTHANDSVLVGVEGHGLWAYNTSKAAVNHLTQQMAVTLSPKFITVNAICPGVFPSKMTAWSVNRQADAIAATHPMGRMGSPRDIAGIFLFLASPASKHINGALIPIDGGALIHGRPLGRKEPEKAKL